MQKMLLFPALLLLCSCGPKAIEIAAPPAERFEPVAEPTVPEGDTDAEVASFIIELVKALRESNGKLEWLRDWRNGVMD